MSNRATILALMVTSVLASGCASGARITPNLNLPANYRETTDAAGRAPASLDAWWVAFEDPALTALVEAALKASPDARSAKARVEEAFATRRALFNQAVLPTGQIVGNANRGYSEVDGFFIPGFSQSGDNRNENANFNVSWELDLFGRRRAAVKEINAELAAVRFEAEAARASLAANVAQSYVQLHALNVQLDNARQIARVQAALANLTARKAKVGIGAGADADRVAGDLAQAQAQTAALEAQLQVARRILLILIGRGTDPDESLALPGGVVIIPVPPIGAPGDLLIRRPDVRQAAARLISASGQLTLNERSIFPTFTLNPGTSFTKGVQPNFETTTKAWSIGIGVAQPVLNIPRLLAEIDAQGARVDQAAIAYEKAVQNAFGEAENALTQLAADRRRVTLLTDGEARTRRAYNAANRRYADGVDDLTQALAAEQSWRASRAALTSAQADARVRAVQAFKALGGGWTPDQQTRASATGQTERNS